MLSICRVVFQVFSRVIRHVTSYSQPPLKTVTTISLFPVRKGRLTEARWLAKTPDLTVKCSFMTTLRLRSKLAQSVVSVSVEHKPQRKNWKEEKSTEDCKHITTWIHWPLTGFLLLEMNTTFLLQNLQKQLRRSNVATTAKDKIPNQQTSHCPRI